MITLLRKASLLLVLSALAISGAKSQTYDFSAQFQPPPSFDDFSNEPIVGNYFEGIKDVLVLKNSTPFGGPSMYAPDNSYFVGLYMGTWNFNFELAKQSGKAFATKSMKVIPLFDDPASYSFTAFKGGVQTGTFTLNNLVRYVNNTIDFSQRSGFENADKLVIKAGTNAGGLIIDQMVLEPITVLPVALKSFDLKKELNQTKLEWSTVSETSNNFFSIERSADGKTFEKLVTVRGAGTSSVTSRYSAFDKSPLKGENYYRLSQTDNDGISKTIAIKSLSFDYEGEVQIYAFPVPVSPNGLFIAVKNCKAAKINVAIFDLAGRAVFKEDIALTQGTEAYKLNLDKKLKSGQYILNVTGEGIKSTSKIIVE